MAIVKNPLLKNFLFVLGVVATALGVIGVFLPILPTTPFILFAAWCFLKSSKRAHDWIYNQRLLGPALKNWEKNRSISRPAKISALSMVFVSLVLIWIKVKILWVQIIITLLLFSVSTFIASRPEA